MQSPYLHPAIRDEIQTVAYKDVEKFLKTIIDGTYFK